MKHVATSHNYCRISSTPKVSLSHVFNTLSITHGTYLKRLRQTKYPLWNVSQTPATDQVPPMESILRVCNRQFTTSGFPLARLRQTNHTPWIISRIVAINNLRICSQTRSTSGTIPVSCPTAFFTFTKEVDHEENQVIQPCLFHQSRPCQFLRRSREPCQGITANRKRRAV